MKFAVLSDIHGNLEALQAVLDDIKSRGGVDAIFNLGDVVGYGPDPHACIAEARNFHNVAGNHDWAVAGKLDGSDFNPHAKIAAMWAADHITQEDQAFLAALPLTQRLGDFTFMHGSPCGAFDYVEQWRDEYFKRFESRFCFVGHTHDPLLLAEGKTWYLPAIVDLRGTERMIINVGSVGQPRDHDPKASYVLVDTDAKWLSHYRVAYDVKAVQDKILKTNLPSVEAYRLAVGD